MRIRCRSNEVPRQHTIGEVAQACDTGGRRYGHMITNLAECVNSVLQGIRNLPIIALVQIDIFFIG